LHGVLDVQVYPAGAGLADIGLVVALSIRFVDDHKDASAPLVQARQLGGQALQGAMKEPCELWELLALVVAEGLPAHRTADGLLLAAIQQRRQEWDSVKEHSLGHGSHAASPFAWIVLENTRLSIHSIRSLHR
jgi:hypothetical protein